MAASTASGILLSRPGIAAAHTSSRTPCATHDSFVCAPAFTFAEERTMTEVIGSPPSRPFRILPTPCAFSSWFGGE